MTESTQDMWKAGPSGRGGIPITTGRVLVASFSNIDDANLACAASEMRAVLQRVLMFMQSSDFHEAIGNHPAVGKILADGTAALAKATGNKGE